jgi:hypothetical protein
VVRCDGRRGLEEGRHVVEELARRYLLDEVGAAVFDACVGELVGVSSGTVPYYLLRRTFKVASWTLGFLFPMRFLSERIASLGCTVLERITSDISRLRGISSLRGVSEALYG